MSMVVGFWVEMQMSAINQAGPARWLRQTIFHSIGAGEVGRIDLHDIVWVIVVPLRCCEERDAQSLQASYQQRTSI